MSKKEKLIARLKGMPKDFTFDELETLLNYFGYELSSKGKTSGSRIMFVSSAYGNIMLHKPHGRKELLKYQIKQIIEILVKEELI